MKQLDRYVGVQVLSSIFVVLLVVLGLNFVFAFMDEIKDTSESYNSLVVLQYLLLKVPGSMYEFLPLSCLVGCLIGLGMLASHSELTVMRAAGISTSRIIMSVIKPALLLAFISMAAGEYVIPVCEQLAQSIKASAKGGGKALQSRYGVWHREADTFIHINAGIPGGKMQGITQFEFDEEGKLAASSFAKHGSYQQGYWQLFDISRTEIGEEGTKVSTQAEQKWQMGLSPDLLSALVVQPKDLSIVKLWSFSGYLSAQQLQADSYFFAFWSKLFQPLTIIALVLIGILFIFGPLRSVTVGQRIIAGVIAGLLFKFVQDLLGQMSTVAGISPLLAVLAPILVCLLIGVVLLKRAKL